MGCRARSRRFNRRRVLRRGRARRRQRGDAAATIRDALHPARRWRRTARVVRGSRLPLSVDRRARRCADRIGGRNRAALSARRRGVLRMRRSRAQQNLAGRCAHAGTLLDRRLHRLPRPRAARVARRFLYPRAVDVHDQHRLAPRATPSANLRAFAARRRSAGDGRGVRLLDFVDHNPRLLIALDSRTRALLRILGRRRDGARADADRVRRAVGVRALSRTRRTDSRDAGMDFHRLGDDRAIGSNRRARRALRRCPR